jgi:hypothetical protein
MFFIVFNFYCKSIENILPYEFLNINRSGWYRFQKENRLPLHHCKSICSYFNHHITDDMDELIMLVVKKFVEVQNG